MTTSILTQSAGRVFTLTLNRPEKRNALTFEMLEQLAAALEGARKSEESVVVLAATGHSFCAGADMRILAGGASEGRRYLIEFNRLLLMMRIFPKPIVAAIQGHAVGGGAELALEADFRIMSSDATLSFPDVQIGSTPGTVQRLVRAVGDGVARRMVLLGEELSADEASRLGVAYKVVDTPEACLRNALDLSNRLCGISSSSLELAKKSLELAHRLDPISELLTNVDAMSLSFAPEGGQREAALAFLREHERRHD